MIAVFDTNIVIDALKGVEAADVEYGRYDRVLISRITWMEVLIGAGEDDADLRDFMELYFEIVPLDLIVAESAVQIRRTKRIRLPDAVILATAQTNGAILVTRNTKDFHPDWEGIRLPYTL
ncbi:MAG: type II toxin-antitoxin system VapC family toxin [Ardenticatenaceae bacterium]|nr:type II toxin-antitoxin system VapC family toxin [Ardenticatenaceae bacterium]